jgi:hypothetical protein
MSFLTPTHLPLAARLGLGLAPFFAFVGGSQFLTRWRLRRALAEAPTERPLVELAAGTPVWVRGTILPQPTVPSLFRGRPAVLFRNRIGGVDETRGIDFHIEVKGERARVAVRDAILLDHPVRTDEPPACGVVFADLRGWGEARLRSNTLIDLPPLHHWSRRHESAVGPGDVVEVAGLLHHEVAPDAVAAFDRGVAVEPVIRRGPRTPLFVRKAQAP